MNVSELLLLALSFGAGIGLGMFYFWGLWLTVRRLATARWPVATSLSSFFGRLAVASLGFYYATNGRLERLIACLVGFVAIRMVVVRRCRPDRRDDNRRGKIGARRQGCPVKISE